MSAMPKLEVPRFTFWRGVLLVILAARDLLHRRPRLRRASRGATNLSDAFPWGLWIGFDILCGVALAAGGFTISATVYIFNLEKFRPIVRPAILTAFLGYVLVIVALMFDLGRPWNVWHPLVMWNPHSVMFEVGWCVTLYTTVLALEFSPDRLRALQDDEDAARPPRRRCRSSSSSASSSRRCTSPRSAPST